MSGQHGAARQRRSNGRRRRGREIVFMICALGVLSMFQDTSLMQQLQQNEPPDIPIGNSAIKDSGIIDEQLIWKLNVEPDGDFYSLPLFQVCKWYGKGVHARRLPSRKAVNEGENVIVESNPRRDTTVLPPSGKLRLVLELPCRNIMKHHKCGTGNWIQHHYMLRILAMHTTRLHAMDANKTQISLDISCVDMQDPEIPRTLVLPWLSGPFSGAQDLKVLQDYWKSQFEDFHVNSICAKKKGTAESKGWYLAPILFMLPLIRQDLRRMAVGLVGAPSDDPDHPAHSYLLSNKAYGSSFRPLLPNVEIDQAAIHFRCGDIMASKRWHMFHFLKFRTYADRIPLNSTKSIGIVTQPFRHQANSQKRKEDDEDVFASTLCMEVTLAFQEYLQQRFPFARVSIRNGPDETVALAFARLIMARHAFAAPDSTFSVFPVLASFGTGYQINKIPGGMNEGISRDKGIIRHDRSVVFIYPNQKEKHEVLPVERTFKLTRRNSTRAREEILEWFRNDSHVILR
jgi:hypothetical protein